MKNIIKTALILTLSLFFLTGISYGAVLTKEEIKKEIQQEVTLQINVKTKAEVVVDIKSIPYNVIALPDGETKIKSTVNLDSFSKYKTAKVEILVNGKQEKLFFVPFELKIYEKVFVANNLISIGDNINYTNTQIEKRDISNNFSYTIPQNFQLNKIKAKRSFKVGDVLDKRYIEIDSDVIKNNIVSITVESGEINLTIEGKAQESGRIGDYIKVKNEKYNKIYTGQITAVNQVLIKI